MTSHNDAFVAFEHVRRTTTMESKMRSMNAIWGGLAAAFVVRAAGAVLAIYIAVSVGGVLTDALAQVNGALDAINVVGR